MNKLFLIVLAVCLVSAHAFVKRDAPAADNKINLQDLQKQFTDTISDIQKQISEAMDPAKIKQGIEQVANQLKEAADKIGKSAETKAQ